MSRDGLDGCRPVSKRGEIGGESSPMDERSGLLVQREPFGSICGGFGDSVQRRGIVCCEEDICGRGK